MPNDPSMGSEFHGKPELIVVTKPEAELQVTAEGVASASGAAIDDLQQVLAEEGVAMAPLFGQAASSPTASLEMEAAEEGDLSLYYQVDAPEERMQAIADRLNASGAVAGAYVKPPAEPATLVMEQESFLNEMEPDVQSPPAVTPNYTSRQDYLEAAPVGIEAAYAWSQSGGGGANVKVIDCEWGWNFTHEDLLQNSLGMVCGASAGSTNHGTAVMGEIGGDRNSFGVTGISPDARLGASSFATQATATAIKCAADNLSAGDIILLEIHRAGPNATGAGQKGYIGVEWWPDDFAAIRYAVNKGIIVVEAAGNGWENLDAAVYDTARPGFPASWRNPFRLTNPQCGAVFVGAGDPPSGTHGRFTSPWNQPYVDRARCGFSNWGARVDCQGWGWEVTTTGYGNLQGGGNANRWYTDTFSGTSSASPIVTGALACTQGALKAKNMPLLTSWRARSLLRSTGSPQQAAPSRPVSQRIGNRPNLRQLIPAAMKTWVNNVSIRFTYALHTPQAAWAYIAGIGWRRIRTGQADGVSNVFQLCCQAQGSGGKVNAYIDGSYLYYVVQL